MKTVCAWCGTLLKGDARDPRVSHGICRTCYKALTGKEPKSKNPDEDLRRLERAARAGDVAALERMIAHATRLGDYPALGRADDISWRMYESVMGLRPSPKNETWPREAFYYAQQVDSVPIHAARLIALGERAHRARNVIFYRDGRGDPEGAQLWGLGGEAEHRYAQRLKREKNPRRSKNPMKCKNPCRNPRHRHSNPWNAQQLDGVARLATSIYSGARTFGFANPAACWNCGSSVSGDVCRKCWAGQTDFMNPPRGKKAKCWCGSSYPHLHVDPAKETRWGKAYAPKGLGRFKAKRKHKSGCACAACSAHRKKVGRRTGASRASHKRQGGAVSSHVKALDNYIAKTMAGAAKRIQVRLHAALAAGKYSRPMATSEWRRLIDQACRTSRIPLSAAHRGQMAKQIAEAFERKIRHGNPSVAIVGAGLNPGRRLSNPTDSRKKGDRGYIGTISLAEARKRAAAAGMLKQFDENVRAHKKFHGSAPSGVRVYRSNDGKKARTVEVGSISGRVPEITYISGKVVGKTNKANKFFVHKTPPKGQPVEVWMAHKKSAMRVGGTGRRTDWYRD